MILRSASISVCLIMTITPGLLAEEESLLDSFAPEQREKLLAGEVLFEHVASDEAEKDGLGHGQAFAVINRPIEECYQVMTDIENKDQFFPRVIECRIIKTQGNRVWVQEVLDFKIKKIEYVLLLTLNPERHRVDFRLDPDYPHSLRDTRGYWYFEEVDQVRSLLTYGVTKVDVGLPVPGFMLKLLSSRDLPGVVRNLKKRIESGGKWTKDHD